MHQISSFDTVQGPSASAVIIIGVYIIAGRWIIKSQFRGSDVAFALLNLIVVHYLFWGEHFRRSFFLYVTVVTVQYVAMRYWSDKAGWWPWLAFLSPITFLVMVRYAPPILRLGGLNSPVLVASQGAVFIGLSYLAFRTSYLVLEVRNGLAPRPGFWRYIGFSFFVPTLSVGPISPYRTYLGAFSKGDASVPPLDRALLRVVVGGVKLRFLAVLLNQLTYSSLLLDGHPHPWVDLPIAAVAYYLYLYCNFSGFCDIAIGGAGLMGIPVAENFDNPFAARNMANFWNRWHITLSQYMRDVVFSPLSKKLVRDWGSAWTNLAIVFTILVVFLIVGVWHGVGWHYVAFGVANGLGVAANHYSTVLLRRRLGKDGFAAYMRSPSINAVATVLTFAYVTATLFLFANDRDSMGKIFSMLGTHS